MCRATTTLKDATILALLRQEAASRRVPRWLGALGLGAALVYSLAQGKLLGLVVPGFPSWGPAGLIGSLLWLGGMVALGVALVRTRALNSQPSAPAGALAALLLVTVIAAPATSAAQTPTRSVGERALHVRPTVAVGVGLALVGLDSYGAALNLRGGADVVFGGSTTHSLAVTLGWTPYNVRGARHIDEATAYVGGAAAVSVGWTIFDHVDVEVSYRQALLAMGTADGPGSIGGSVGGRL